MKFRPLSDRVLVKRLEAMQQTASGLFIPETAKEKPQEAMVIAVGPGEDDKALTVKPGDRVLFGKYSGEKVEIDGDEHIILHESDLLAVIDQA